MRFLKGFGMRWYRSFYGEMQYLSPMGKIVLLAGQNDAGKSNVIRFAHRVLKNIGGTSGLGGGFPALDNLDSPQNLSDSAGMELAIAYGTVQDVVLAIQDILAKNPVRNSMLDPQALAKVFTTPAFQLIPSEDLVWFRFSQSSRSGQQQRIELSQSQLQAFPVIQVTERILHNASSTLMGATGGTLVNLRNVISKLDPFMILPPVELVEAFRQVRTGTSETGEGRYSGQDLIAELARLQDPDVTVLESRKRFEGISGFVGKVLEDNSATLNIPHHRNAIYVRRGNLTLPLSNLGTGVEQVIILAAAATLLQETLVCIEEPEIHLHPILQRKLLKYLAEETSNQYLIATHFAHMLDAELASIFHITRTERGTEIKHAAQPKDRAAICADLGYRPSDLVQANAVIWVEGPSDRIYIRNFLSIIDDSLVEGIHYSIMFYGGRLLNHLSADDPDVDDFISLRRLNRHIAIVMDSDKTSMRTRINPTKIRVRGEFDKGPGFAWITSGYTIENYIPPDILSQAVAVRHPNAKFRWKGEHYVNPLGTPSLIAARADKVAIAREVVRLWDSTTSYSDDLNRQLRRCVNFIRSANGMS